MYFGCRHKNEDYLYQEELEEAEKNAVLTQLNVAFSRDQEHKVELTNSCQAYDLGSAFRINSLAKLLSS